MSSLYSKRPEWADVTPLQQYELANPLVPIFYSEEYRDATDYFRGIVKTGEMSERALHLTEHVIRLNPSHYSAWQYRYKTLLELGSNLYDELRLMDEIAVENLKTYQVWHHRRLLLTKLASASPSELSLPQDELQFIARSLEEDSKNYHTWSYRQWLLAYFNHEDLWKHELEYAEDMLEVDVRNNSAWHHRFFVVFQSGVRKGDEDREAVVKRELAFAKEKIALAPNNASAWNYLRGVLKHNQLPFATLKDFVLPYSLQTTEQFSDVVDLENPLPSKGASLPCSAAIEFLADVYEADGANSVTKAVELWKSLANEHDTIRKRYWEYRIRDVQQAA